VLNDRLANDVRRNGTHSSGTDDDRVLRDIVYGTLCRALFLSKPAAIRYYHCLYLVESCWIVRRESGERCDSAGNDGTGRKSEGQGAREDGAGCVLDVSRWIFISQLALDQLTNVAAHLRQTGVSSPGTANSWHARFVDHSSREFLHQLTDDCVIFLNSDFHATIISIYIGLISLQRRFN